MKQQVVLMMLMFGLTKSSGWAALAVEQKQLYMSRDFLALEMSKMIEDDRRFVQLQKNDLRSCRFVREGRGDIKSVLICMRFLAREKGYDINNASSRQLFVEMDRLCSIGASSIPGVESVLEMNIPWRQISTSRCLQEILRLAGQQIRVLHRRNLIKAWGMYKKVLAELNPPPRWQKEVKQWSGF